MVIKSMKKNPIIFLFLLLTFLTFESYSQNLDYGKSTGRVLDKRTGAPLENANVYLVNTTLGSSTNKAGRYNIENVPPGKYIIIVSVVGYARDQSTLEIQKNRNTKIDFELKKRPVVLDEVTVNADDDWEDNLETFKEKLLGDTQFTDSCYIANPNVIYFTKDEDDNFVAKSDGFVVILNNALGYKIDLLINRFVWNTATDIGSYSLYPRFEEMQSDDNEKLQLWKENRAKAYTGSFRHFLRIVAKDSLPNSNFALFQGSVAEFTFNKKTPVDLREMEVEYEENYVRFCLPDPYLIRNNYLHHLNQYDLMLNQNCVIVAYDCLLFNYDGIIFNPEKIQLSGYWANQRIADALPYNYIIE